MSPNHSGSAPTWRRSPEASALFNPVLSSELILTACHWRNQEDGQGIPWPAVFLVLPLALHPETRSSMPRDARITLPKWVTRNGYLVADLEARTHSMAEATRRGIRHGLRVERLRLDGASVRSTAVPKTMSSQWPSELSSSSKAARMYGRWLAGVETHEALALLGIGIR